MALLADDLQSTIDALKQTLADAWTADVREAVTRASDGCRRIGESWSGSTLDYHASCYYRDFETVPPGREFSTEWGLSGVGFANTEGWKPRSYDDVWNALAARGQAPDFDRLEAIGQVCEAAFREHKARVLSVLSAALATPDGYLDRVRQQVKGLEVVSDHELLRSAQGRRRSRILDIVPGTNLRPVDP